MTPRCNARAAAPIACPSGTSAEGPARSPEPSALKCEPANAHAHLSGARLAAQAQVAWIDAEHVGEALVEPNPIHDLGRLLSARLHGAIDAPNTVTERGRSARHGVVSAAWASASLVHAEPE